MRRKLLIAVLLALNSLVGCSGDVNVKGVPEEIKLAVPFCVPAVDAGKPADSGKATPASDSGDDSGDDGGTDAQTSSITGGSPEDGPAESGTGTPGQVKGGRGRG